MNVGTKFSLEIEAILVGYILTLRSGTKVYLATKEELIDRMLEEFY